jgi:hypothetical protein
MEPNDMVDVPTEINKRNDAYRLQKRLATDAAARNCRQRAAG